MAARPAVVLEQRELLFPTGYASIYVVMYSRHDQEMAIVSYLASDRFRGAIGDFLVGAAIRFL
jgi:hypothetical protein